MFVCSKLFVYKRGGEGLKFKRYTSVYVTYRQLIFNPKLSVYVISGKTRLWQAAWYFREIHYRFMYSGISFHQQRSVRF